MGFPSKHTGLGCHFLLQGIFPTQGSNLHLLHRQVDSLPLIYQESSKEHVKKRQRALNSGWIIQKQNSTVPHFGEASPSILKRRPASPFTSHATTDRSHRPFVPRFLPLVSATLRLADLKATANNQLSETAFLPMYPQHRELNPCSTHARKKYILSFQTQSQLSSKHHRWIQGDWERKAFENHKGSKCIWLASS